ncbi:unnamed protein product, partial [Staurois parvus]
GGRKLKSKWEVAERETAFKFKAPFTGLRVKKSPQQPVWGRRLSNFPKTDGDPDSQRCVCNAENSTKYMPVGAMIEKIILPCSSIHKKEQPANRELYCLTVSSFWDTQEAPWQEWRSVSSFN